MKYQNQEVNKNNIFDKYICPVCQLSILDESNYCVSCGSSFVIDEDKDQMYEKQF